MSEKPTYEKLERRVQELEQAVSELKEAEGKLRESESRLREAQQLTHMGNWFWDVNSGKVEWSNEVFKIFRLDPKEFTPQINSILDLSPWPEDHQRDKELIRKAVESHEVGSYEQRFLRPDGSTGFYFSSFQGVYDDSGKLTEINGTVQDITERKRMEEVLRESEEKYRTLSLNIPGMIYRAMPDWSVEIISNSEIVCGYSHNEFATQKVTWLDLIHIDDKQQIFEERSKLLEKQMSIIQEYRILAKDGTTHWVSDHKASFFKEDGSFISIDGIVYDITERKRTEKSLKESQETFITVLDGIDSKIYVADMETYEILFMNKNMKDSFGADLTGKICWEVLRNESGPCSNCTNDKLLDEEGNPAGVQVWNDHQPITGKWYINYDRAIKWTDGRYVRLQVASDITDFKKMEEQLRQSQKMEAIGTLAGGVAHDFNNLLTTIIGNADLGLMDLGKDHPLREGIEDIRKAANSAASLTRQLLAFSRKQVIKPEVLDLNEVITATEKMIKRLIKEDVELSTVLEPEPWKVHADQGQIEQVIMNLTVNARDAMPQGGRLTIETANIDLGKDYFRKHGIEEQTGSFVLLSVSHTGIGMDKEIQARIFEPFFTSKGIGKGTGLGLSTVYGIVKQNNGFVWIYSEPGQGSTFKIYLPKVKGDVKEEGKEQTFVESLVGSETVLIVEDDDGLRKLAQKSLQPHGYRVLVAENGEDALRVSKEHNGPIHLMITDVVMPRMGGKEVAERLQSFYPHMKVLYMSGYTDKTIVDHGVLAPGLNFLEKPFSTEGLARKVREVLDKK